MTDRSGASIHPLLFHPVSIQSGGSFFQSGRFSSTPRAERRLDEILDPYDQSCEEVLEGMDPLETWLDERRPRDESCRIAAWLELELDCAEHGAGVPMQ